MSTIISVSLETNDLSQFTSTSGDIAVSTSAKMGKTNYGLAVTTDGLAGDWGIVLLGANNTSGITRFRVYIRPNGLTMADGDVIAICSVRNDNSDSIGLLYLNKNGANYVLYAVTYDDAVTLIESTHQTITDAEHYAEIKVTKGSGAPDGTFNFWVDGELIYTKSDIDNDTRFTNVRSARMGTASPDASTTGTYHLDELIVNDDGGLIGPVSSLVFGQALPTANESPVSWDNNNGAGVGWSDGAAAQQTVSGDASWGKLELEDGEEGRSQVYDMGDAYTRTFTITENVYGTGQGDADLEIRGDANVFAQDDALPAWNAYVGPTTQAWRYVQVRESRE